MKFESNTNSARVAWLTFMVMVGGGSSWLTPSTFAAQRAVLIGPELKPRQVHLQALGGGRIAYFGKDRTLKREPLSDWVALRVLPPKEEGSDEPAAASDGGAVSDNGNNTANGDDDDAASQPAPAGRIQRTDGQRLAGSLIGGVGDGQAVLWAHPTFDRVRVPLEKLAGFRVSKGALGPASTDDRVQLANGDTLTGFVEAIKPKTLTIQPNGSDQPVPLPLKRIEAVRLASSAEPWPKDSQTLVMSDGSRLAVSDLSLSDQTLRGQSAWLSESITPSLSAIERVAFTAGAWRLIDLTQRSFEVTGGGEVFSVPMPPRREKGALMLHAPVTLRFPLPKGAARLAANLVLAPDAGDEAVARWADCQVTLTTQAGESHRFHLAGLDQRRQRVNVPLSGDARTLTLQIAPAVNGPILDRVHLINAQVLVRNPSDAE